MAVAHKLWVEQYRPRRVSDYVFRDQAQRSQVEGWLNAGALPHLLFTGSPGTGKTTLAKVLLNELDVDSMDVLEINASNENSVDTIRNKIVNFSGTMPFGDMKYVLLDECLRADTPVVVLRQGIETLVPISDLDPVQDLVKSYNLNQARLEWKPFQLFNKGTQDTLEIEFENNQVVICTPDHKWYVEDDTGSVIVVRASELHKYSHILSC